MSNAPLEVALAKKRMLHAELDGIDAMDIERECKATLQVLIFSMNYLDEMGLLSQPFEVAVASMKEHYFSFDHQDTLAKMLGG